MQSKALWGFHVFYPDPWPDGRLRAHDPLTAIALSTQGESHSEDARYLMVRVGDTVYPVYGFAKMETFFHLSICLTSHHA